MDLVRALRLTSSPCLALVGAGGKSTALFQLARQLSTSQKLPVLVTASTHLHVDQIKQADSHERAVAALRFGGGPGPDDVESLVSQPCRGEAAESTRGRRVDDLHLDAHRIRNDACWPDRDGVVIGTGRRAVSMTAKQAIAAGDHQDEEQHRRESAATTRCRSCTNGR